MVNSMYNESRNILLVVEGADDEVNLFGQIIKCFPEIKLSHENVLVYNTNLWVLNDDLCCFGTVLSGLSKSKDFSQSK